MTAAPTALTGSRDVALALDRTLYSTTVTNTAGQLTGWSPYTGTAFRIPHRRSPSPQRNPQLDPHRRLALRRAAPSMMMGGLWSTLMLDPSDNEMLKPLNAALTAIITLVPDSRTPERGSLWRASCEWAGRTITAESRSAASHALCRELVAAGCPDLPLVISGSEGKERMRVQSIHRAARYTIRETDSQRIRMALYQPPMINSGGARFDQDALISSPTSQGPAQVESLS